MAHHYHFDQYIARMEREGIDRYHASKLDGADEAHALDLKLDEAETRTKRDWPTTLDHFTSTDELRAAMQDPAYKVNAHYRAKVESMLAKSAPEIGAVRNPTHDQDESPLSGDSMLKAARKEAAIATYKKLAVEAASDPVKRLELLTLMHSKDEAVQAWLNEGSGAVANEGPGQRMMREAGSGSFGPDLSKAMADDLSGSGGEDKQ